MGPARARRRRAALKVNYGILSVYLLGVFVGALDVNVLGPVFPLISHSFHISLGWTAWTITTYSVIYVAATIFAGSAGDRFGHKRLFALGLVAFGLASALAAISGVFWLFLVARGLQGAGAGAVYPNAQAEGIRQFPPERRGTALGIFGAAFGLASIIGPNLGGLIGQYLGWPAIFLFNLPIIALALVLSRRAPASRTAPGAVPDIAGGLSFAAFLALALLALAVGGPLRWLLAAAALASLVVFSRRQSLAAVPFLNTAPLRKTAGIAMIIGAGLIGLDMSAAVFVPSLTQKVLGFSVLGSGVALMPAAFSGAILAGVGGVLVDRVGARSVLQVGLLAGILGGILLGLSHLTLGPFILAMVAFGLATAFTMGAPLNRIALGLYRDEQSGEALSLIAVFRSVGLAAGPVLLTVAARWHSFQGMFGAVAVSSALAFGIFFLVPNVRPGPRKAGHRAA